MNAAEEIERVKGHMAQIERKRRELTQEHRRKRQALDDEYDRKLDQLDEIVVADRAQLVDLIGGPVRFAAATDTPLAAADDAGDWTIMYNPEDLGLEPFDPDGW